MNEIFVVIARDWGNPDITRPIIAFADKELAIQWGIVAIRAVEDMDVSDADWGTRWDAKATFDTYYDVKTVKFVS